MKPLRLELQAFGPFVARETIDFTRLGDNPLFLINGPTGAGKSSILDAICFALYGELTGAEKDPMDVRCDRADPAMVTEVTLDFSLADKRFRVRRTPTQERLKTRGEGTTIQRAEAQLWEMDGDEEGRLLVAKKVNEATEQIVELLGLKVEQFRQVMVLPQGKFRDLLLADSSDRESIFIQLFQTGIYSRIEAVLKDKAKGIKREVENHNTRIKAILESAEVNSEAELKHELAALHPQVKALGTERDKAERGKVEAELAQREAEAVLARFRILAAKQQELATMDKRRPAIDASQAQLLKAELAQGLSPLFAQLQKENGSRKTLEKRLQDSVATLDKVRQRLVEAEKQYSKAQLANKKAEPLHRRQLQMERAAQQLVQLAPLELALQAANQSLADQEKHLNSILEEQVRKGTAKDSLEASRAQLELQVADLGDQRLALEKLTNHLEERQQLETLRELTAQQIDEQKECQRQLAEAKQVLEAASHSALQTERHWHLGQAALLAAQLKDGLPCPVCGSLEHPQPGHKKVGEELVSKQEVEAARDGEVAARNAFHQLQAALHATVLKLETSNKECARLEKSLQSLAVQSLQVVEQAHRAASAEVKNLQRKKQDLQQQEKQLDKDRQALDELVSRLDAVRASVQSSQSAQANAVAKRNALRDEVPEGWRDIGVLEAALAKVKQQLLSMAQELAQTQKELDGAKTTAVEAETENKSLGEQQSEQARVYAAVLEEWQAKLRDSTFADEMAFLNARLDETARDTLKSSIDTYKAESASLQGAVKQLQGELENVVRPDLDVVVEALKEKIVLYAKADQSWQKASGRCNELKKVQQQITQAHEINSELEQQYAVYGTLSEVASGQRGNKINLQRFVLGVLLEDVLIQASARLKAMSSDRYILLRREDRTKGNKASGLELDVEDSYTGKTRPVSTLSGGESFMAALSLALGLSDVVQSYAGGIRLDTLFIDEGFGSLDPDSLELALQTLIDLRAGGRMIGVISHVSELKEQMDLRLEVRGGQGGSSITVAGAH